MSEDIELVLSNVPVPRSYAFLPKGSTYRTLHAQRLTRAANRPVFIVLDYKTKARTGIRVPSKILQEALRLDQLTKTSRLAAAHKRDEVLLHQARTVLRECYSQLPSPVLEQCLQRAFLKGSRRVGRRGKIDMKKRVQLALAAHVRHTQTSYDKLLKTGSTKEDARREIKGKMIQVLASWRRTSACKSIGKK